MTYHFIELKSTLNQGYYHLETSGQTPQDNWIFVGLTTLGKTHFAIWKEQE